MSAHRRPLVLILLATLVQLWSYGAHAGSINWNNAAGGNFSIGANWVGGVAPGPSDDAVINLAGTHTVTLDVSSTVTGLTLGGGGSTPTLNLNGNTLTLNGPGTINAGGILLCRGTLAGTVR